MQLKTTSLMLCRESKDSLEDVCPYWGQDEGAAPLAVWDIGSLAPMYPRGVPPERPPTLANPYPSAFLFTACLLTSYVTCIRRLCVVRGEVQTERAK
jgi:hypothetical protein